MWGPTACTHLDSVRETEAYHVQAELASSPQLVDQQFVGLLEACHAVEGAAQAYENSSLTELHKFVGKGVFA